MNSHIHLAEGNVRKVNDTDIKNILQQTFGENCSVYVSNREYYILDPKQVEKFIKKDQTDRLKNRSPHNMYDFSRILIGRALESVLIDQLNVGISIGEIRGLISIDGNEKPKNSSYVLFITTMNNKINTKRSTEIVLLDPKTDQCFLPNRLSIYETIFI